MINNDRLYQVIADQLKAVRKKNKLTQSDMAEILGLERTSVTNIELGKQRPGVHILYRCCEYFGIPISKFLPTVNSVALADLPPEAARILEQKRRQKSADFNVDEGLTNADT
ncbi:MAG: helix-turn-helix transcriptional regulator [Pseudomonadota bacterium]